MKRVTFAAQQTVLEHNFGYLKSSLLKRLFGCNKDIRKSLSILDKQAHKKRTPKQYKAKKKVGKSKDYEGGAF